MTGDMGLGVRRIGVRYVNKQEKTLVTAAFRVLYLQRVPQTGLAAIYENEKLSIHPYHSVVTLNSDRNYI